MLAMRPVLSALSGEFLSREVEIAVSRGVPEPLVTPITPHRVCMKGTESGGKACIASERSAEHGYRCSIYADRPSPCREFNILNADGTENEDCKKLRLQIGLPLSGS